MTSDKLILTGVATTAVAAAIVGGVVFAKSNNTNPTPNSETNLTKTETQSSSSTSSTTYKDGEYSSEGQYFSPDGNESISVSITLKSNVVEDVTSNIDTNSRESRQYQDRFLSGYKSKVVGKKLDEISLGKISGSSLTSKGFMDALGKIKTQAKSS